MEYLDYLEELCLRFQIHISWKMRLKFFAGRRAWEPENGGVPKKKSSRKKAPTLNEKWIGDARAKRSATGKSKSKKV